MNEENLWKFGTIFLKKYFFVFNTEEKTIGFYNNKIKVNKFQIKNLNTIICYYFRYRRIFLGEKNIL